MPAQETYFVRLDEHRFRPTHHTSGAWGPDEQHISPLNGLVVHEIERRLRGDDGPELLVSRIGVDIFGVPPLREFEIAVETVRRGRTVDLVEAVTTSGGRVVARTRVWRLQRSDTAVVAGGAPAALPHPDGLPSRPLRSVWPGGYIASLDVRPVGEPAAGRTTAWVGTPVVLLADEPVADLARFVGLIDTANGIAVRQRPGTWLFPNVDLTVHLYRQPSGGWVGLDTTVTFGPDGAGLTSSALHDVHGAVGRAEQMLTLRPGPGPLV